MSVPKPTAPKGTAFKTVDVGKTPSALRKGPTEASAEDIAIELGELSELLGYSLKRA
jgi:hypothetical protein